MRALAIVLLLTGLVGCASPNPNLYVMTAVPGTARPARTGSVELRRVGLAGYLDRSEIVRSDAQYRLKVSDIDRWGEPLGSMLERVFTEDLVQRLPSASVFTEAGAISTRPDLVLEIDVQRLDADATGNVVLLAQVAIQHDDATRPTAATEVRLTLRPAGARTTDLVAAMSSVVGQFADEVARRLVAQNGAPKDTATPPKEKRAHARKHRLPRSA